MARMVSSSGISRRSSPRISAPICWLSGTTSSLVRVMSVMAVSPQLRLEPTLSLGGDRRRVASRLAVLDFATGQGGENLRNQLARGRRAQFHRDALAPAIRFADEVDAECVIERRVEGMIVVDVGSIDPHPAVRPLGAAQKLGLLDDVRAHGDLLECQAARAATVAARCLWKKTNTLSQPSSACSGR